MRAPPRSRFPAVVTAAGIAAFLLWLAAFALGRWGSEPVRAMVSGVSPLSRVFVEDHADYGYAGSPWERYVALEAAHVELPADELGRFADGLAEELGWWLRAETGEADLAAAERALWEAGRQEELPLRIARALVARGVAYAPESLLSRSFAADLGREREAHLDCDQLVDLYLHLGWRLDLDLAAVPAPLHLYVVYRPPEGVEAEPLTVETTAFADADEDAGSYLVPGSWHPTGRGRTIAVTPELVEAARMYEPLDDRGLEDEIVANLVLGLVEAGEPVDAIEMLEARLEGTRNTLVVSNLHVWLVEEARRAVERGQPEVAARKAARAIRLRETHGALNLWPRHDERVVMGQAMKLLRGDVGSRSALDRAIARGEASDVCHVLSPLGDELGQLLPACDTLSTSRAGSP